MKSLICIFMLSLVMTATAVAAAPSITAAGIVNAASYAPPGLPGSNIAQGSLFIIFGTNMGPANLQQAGSFPLPTNLGGTSITVTVAATTVSCIMIYTSANQVAAILPSSAPVGTGTLTLTFNGSASSSVAITVVSGSFGIFTLNEAGTGPGIITDANYKLIERNNTAKAGDVLIIWGTGLGPVTGNEAGGALPGDMPNIPITVYIGGQKASVSYRGRSGCCAALDQIVFTVPAGVTGCSVPVTVQIGNTVGNYVTTALGTGGTCTDPTSPNNITTILQNGGSFGFASLGRSTSSTPAIGPIPASTTTTDTGSASFVKYTAQQLALAQNPFQAYTIGSCVVYTYSGQSASIVDPIKPVGLDAGNQITVNGPNGTKQLPELSGSTKGVYTATLGGGSGLNPPPLYLSPGSYTLTGPGGADVGAFSLNLTVPPNLTWTNMSSVAASPIIRANGQLITWTGGDPNGNVTISGGSLVFNVSTPNASVGAFFLCTAPVSAGQFNIPAPVLLALPPSSTISTGGISIPTGSLAVGGYSQVVKFTAPGLDVGYADTSVTSTATVTYQ
jgi:uncharacterized protein (TIGR03437 family)